MTIRYDTPVVIEPADSYSLQVIGGSGYYQLLLDGKLLAPFHDDSFSHGGIGVGLELFHPGGRALVASMPLNNTP